MTGTKIRHGYQFEPSSRRRAITCAWISAAPSKIVEDAGIAQDARDRKFEREAVAAVDLYGVVGRGPRHPRGEQLGHAGLEIAAPAGILGRAAK